MDTQQFDVIIAGAGPSGSSCAISLANSGLKVALVDKAVFPRDKTCGDALGIDVINQLSRMSEELGEKFKLLQNKSASYGIKVFSADHSSIAIPLYHNGIKSCGYVVPRMEFDNLLFQHAKEQPNIHCFENTVIEKIERSKDAVTVITNNGTLQAPIIVGADGAHSVVAKQLSDITVDKDHYCAGLRIYYEGVDNFEQDGLIELHFFKDIAPGYLWLFPMANNKANVGIGMLSSVVSKNKVNLKETLQQLIATHPGLRERFTNARPLETVKGYGLPLGSTKRNISGERFILAGDAAGLIDPFTGEGIANSIRSGRFAARQVLACNKATNYTASFIKNYDREIYKAMWKEFKLSSLLQKLSTYPRLCNIIVKRANAAGYIRKQLEESLASIDKRKSLFSNPKFYLKVFFSPSKENKAN
jgi:geranylgeranyl reductase family protein